MVPTPQYLRLNSGRDTFDDRLTELLDGGIICVFQSSLLSFKTSVVRGLLGRYQFF